MEHIRITAGDTHLPSRLAHAHPLHQEATDHAVASARLGAAAAPARMERSAGTAASLNAAVDYVELPTGRPRTVVLVRPAIADAGAGRVSVLSPVGRALLGCSAGDHADAQLPNGQLLRLLVADVRPEAHDG